MPDALSFEIVTPEGLKYQDDIYSVSLPTAQGHIGILPNHIPLITIITPGVITIHKHKDQGYEAAQQLATAGGFADIDSKRVRLLADSAQRAEEIDEAKAQAALEQAKHMHRQAKDALTLKQALVFINQETARLKVAQFKRGWKQSKKTY